MSKGKILIVDDEQDILEFVSYNLTKEGYVVVKSGSPLEALDICTKNTFDLIILDLMMPEMDGIELCYKIRNEVGLKDVFITFLTARSEDYSLIAGLNAGADDYIKKPIQPRVLVTKINSLMKRMKHVHSDNPALAETLPNGLVIDREKFVVIQNDKKYYLPKKEFELLELLSSVPERVFTREEIYSKVWGDHLVVGDRTIDVHIRKLREKIGEEIISTVKGVGYRFNPAA
jgi:two-component system alkaline phosphatase synthesis response regulator PhoP